MFPRGSVIGPLLLTLGSTPVGSLIRSHNLDRHLYADDTQVYISLSTEETYLYLTHLGDSLSDISDWMTNNKLRLNADKTDFIIISTPRQRRKLTRFLPKPILNHSISHRHAFENSPIQTCLSPQVSTASDHLLINSALYVDYEFAQLLY